MNSEKKGQRKFIEIYLIKAFKKRKEIFNKLYSITFHFSPIQFLQFKAILYDYQQGSLELLTFKNIIDTQQKQ